MHISIQKLFLTILLSAAAVATRAQVTWPSPEVEQMYRHAHDYEAAGNYADAIITYRQAILLAPGVVVLYSDLGHALYAAHNYKEATDVLTLVLTKPAPTEQNYKWLALSQAAQGSAKQAVATLRKGIQQHPAAGELYLQLGNIYMQDKKRAYALDAWLDGTEKAPAMPENYAAAAGVYLASAHPLWGLLYGELYLAMAHDTTGEHLVKSKLVKGYKAFFDSYGHVDVTWNSDAANHKRAGSFEDAVADVYSTLTPVVSDGISTENLTMVRTRFLMEWGSRYAVKYPFSLFAYMDKVIRNGRFDMYNEWLFGKAESPVEYKAWNEFHEGDMQRFLEWEKNNRLVPGSGEHYNKRNMEGLFKGN